MTPASRKFFILFTFLFVCFIQTGWTQYVFTNEIISNDILRIDGIGRALSIISSKGLNYTDDMTLDSISWKGFMDVKPFPKFYEIFASPLTAGPNNALICLEPKNNHINEVLLYTFPENIAKITLDFNYKPFLDTVSADVPFAFWGINSIWFNGAFWVACIDGGLVKILPPLNDIVIYYPGKNKTSYTFQTFHPDSFSIFPDSTTRAMAVTNDSQFIWLACEQALWSFNSTDTTWSQVNDSILKVQEYFDIEIKIRNDTTIIYSFVSVLNGTNIDTCIYTYNTLKDQWNKFINEAENITSIAVGAKEYVYLLDEEQNKILLYKDSLPDIPLDPHVPYAQINIDVTNVINNRIADALTYNYDLTDINYTIVGSDTLFQVATTIGLLYSNNEHYDEVNEITFKYASRKVPLASNLGKTYAVPGIINNNYPEAYFAYNLSKDDDVTIDIFDYNMDHVVRIIDNAPRLAGKHRTSGRSTVRMYDRWDGTVNGRPVPPGVYFYRIKTEKGKRAFGKVIVARN